VKGQLQVKFLDHYHDDPYEWQDFHDCAHFLLAGTAAESSVGTVTQARVPVVFTIPPAFSAPPPVAAVVKTEDPASILQDSLRRMETMFAGIIYQNTHRGAPAAYAPPQQYAAPPQQYAALPRQYAAPLPQQYYAPPPQSYTASAVPTSAGPRPEQKCHFDGCPRMIRDCPGAVDYVGRGLCKRDPASNQIVLLNNAWIPRWTAGNNIKERIDDYYRQNPVPTAVSAAILPHMSQNLLEIVENLHAAVSADPDNTDDDEAVIQALQQALEQKKKRVRFNGVEMPARKGKAPESILKQPDHAGITRGTNQSSAASPSAPVPRVTISTPVIIPTATVKNTAAADTSGPQY
jgi:hypothetical protein